MGETTKRASKNVVSIREWRRRNGITQSFSPFSGWEMLESERFKKTTLRNIIDSYQSIYDLPIELVQNAVDAVELRAKKSLSECAGDEDEYTPQIWVMIDLRNNEITLIDNGYGMNKEEIKRMLIPNYTLKDQVHKQIGCCLRGHKGVGATYLAYGFNYIRISTIGVDGFLSYELGGGRDWAMSDIPSEEPKASPSQESAPPFHDLERGTAVTVRVGKGTRPSALSRIGSSAKQWEMILRTKTALGLVDLGGWQKWAEKVKIQLVFTDKDGNRDELSIPFSYPLPHEYQYFDFLDLKEYYEKNPETANIRLKDKDKHAIYRTWRIFELTEEGKGLLKEKEVPNLSRQNALVYAFFSHSSTLYDSLNKAAVENEKSILKIVAPGVWVAAHNAVVGRSMPLDLTYGAGNKNRLFMLVQLRDVRPDLGRKGFDPELEKEIQKTGECVVKYFVNNRKYLKSAGLQSTQAEHKKELHQRIRDAEKRAEQYPLPGNYSLSSIPENEPEVIGLFQEMLGRGNWSDISCSTFITLRRTMGSLPTR